MISVIIPAHNEGGVIERCLRALLADAPREAALELIVVCNGCTDDTAARARAVRGPVQVLETAVASKSHALNLGDAAARGFPRFYVDADVEMSYAALRRVAEVLGGQRVLAAAPRMRVRLDGRGWLVRAYYAIWLRLPYCRAGMIGSGVYALSESGRRRFERFPSIISDDGFVRAQFGPDERAAVDDVEFTVTPPRNLWSVIKIKTRSQYGKYELYACYPELKRNDPRRYGGIYGEIARRPRLWPCAAVYAFVLAMARLRCAWRWARGRRNVWDRDDSSRAEAPIAIATATKQDVTTG